MCLLCESFTLIGAAADHGEMVFGIIETFKPTTNDYDKIFNLISRVKPETRDKPIMKKDPNKLLNYLMFPEIF